MAEPALDAALYSALTGDATVAGLVGSGVYKGQAPQDATRPYIIFFPSGGGEQNITPRRSKNELYMIRAVADTNASAIAVDSAISAALHKKPDGLIITGWNCYSLLRETRISIPIENIQGVQAYTEGAYYRIRLAKTTLDD